MLSKFEVTTYCDLRHVIFSCLARLLRCASVLAICGLSVFAHADPKISLSAAAKSKLGIQTREIDWQFSAGESPSYSQANSKISSLSKAIEHLHYPKSLAQENIRLEIRRSMNSTSYRERESGAIVFKISAHSDSQYDTRFFSEKPNEEPLLIEYKKNVLARQKKSFGSESGGGRFGRYARWLWPARDWVCQPPDTRAPADYEAQLIRSAPKLKVISWSSEEQPGWKQHSVKFKLMSEVKHDQQDYRIEMRTWYSGGVAYFHRVSVSDSSVLLDTSAAVSSTASQSRILAAWDLSNDCVLLGGRLTGVDRADKSAFRMSTISPNGALTDSAYMNRRILSWDKIYGSAKALELSKTRPAATKEMRVGILDTGVDYNHRSLAEYIPRDSQNQIVGLDAADKDSLPYDFDYNKDTVMSGLFYHGTAVASRVVAGWRGQRQNLRLVPLRISRTEDRSLYELVKWAAENQVKVINVSQGGSNQARWKWLEKAMTDFPNILFVSAAGNESRDLQTHVDYPAHFQKPNHIVVAAVDSTGRPAYEFTNYGKAFVDLAAPGVDLKLAMPENREYQDSGTSFASPYIAGLAASIWELQPTTTATEIKKQILDQCSQTPQLERLVRCHGYIL
jgi:hypothetical protein